MYTAYGMNTPMTGKQLETLRIIANEENGGKPLDLDEIMSKLSFKTTKQNFQFVIRALIKRELIEKLECETIRHKKRRILKITPLGLNRLRNEPKRTMMAIDTKSAAIAEREKTDRLIEEIEKDFADWL